METIGLTLGGQVGGRHFEPLNGLVPGADRKANLRLHDLFVHAKDFRSPDGSQICNCSSLPVCTHDCYPLRIRHAEPAPDTRSISWRANSNWLIRIRHFSPSHIDWPPPP